VSQATGLANAQYNPTVVSLASKDSRTTSLEDRSRKVALTSSQYPKRLESLVQVHVIQSRDHILNTYSDKISDYAETGMNDPTYVSEHLLRHHIHQLCGKLDAGGTAPGDDERQKAFSLSGRHHRQSGLLEVG
jgi:hypothetical protein